MDNLGLKNAWDLCTLVRCALHGEVPQWEDLDLPAVYQLAKSHSITAITFFALEGADAEGAMAPELYSAWRQAREMNVRRNLRLTMERQQILRALDDIGCWYLPLKGVVLDGLYPKLGMRQMADNDILFDPAFRKQVKDLFLGRGYECETYDKGNHDVYLKDPVYNYEMHVALFGSTVSEVAEAYYRDVEKRLLPGVGMERAFSSEDFYVYFLAHGHKHFSGGGNGLRFLVDCYVYLQKTQLDMEYVRRELKKLGLVDFEKLVRSLSGKLFGTVEPLTQEEQEAFTYCVFSGTYGTLHNIVEHRIKHIQEDTNSGSAKAKYLLWRLWPDQRWFQQCAPFFAKWRILKPFFLIWRFFRGLVRNGKNILRELKIIAKLNLK